MKIRKLLMIALFVAGPVLAQAQKIEIKAKLIIPETYSSIDVFDGFGWHGTEFQTLMNARPEVIVGTLPADAYGHYIASRTDFVGPKDRYSGDDLTTPNNHPSSLTAETIKNMTALIQKEDSFVANYSKQTERLILPVQECEPVGPWGSSQCTPYHMEPADVTSHILDVNFKSINKTIRFRNYISVKYLP